MNTMLSDETVTKVREIIMGQLDVAREQVTSEAAIKEDLGADSLDEAEIAMKVEAEFNVTLPDDQLERVRTFGDLCEELARRKAGAC
jgi:acyl carrier protein